MFKKASTEYLHAIDLVTNGSIHGCMRDMYVSFQERHCNSKKMEKSPRQRLCIYPHQKAMPTDYARCYSSMNVNPKSLDKALCDLSLLSFLGKLALREENRCTEG